jgi:hypothetical protein
VGDGPTVAEGKAVSVGVLVGVVTLTVKKASAGGRPVTSVLVAVGVKSYRPIVAPAGTTIRKLIDCESPSTNVIVLGDIVRPHPAGRSGNVMEKVAVPPVSFKRLEVATKVEFGTVLTVPIFTGFQMKFAFC